MKPANETELPLAKMPAQEIAVQPPGISIEQAFNAAATKALDKDSLDVMKQLLAMDAERKFNAAYVAMQSEMPIIVATSVIPNRGKYERYEDVLRKVSPIMSKHGFSVSFSQYVNENRIIETCKLMHIGGHSQSNSFAVRAGGKADSDTQADCKASTTAKRNAFCNALNIVIAQDIFTSENDASIEGDPSDFITPAQVDELRHRVGMLADAVDMPAFWKFAQATKFAEIPTRRYADIDLMLRRKESVGK